MSKNKTSIVILAAGLGTRMKSRLPKVLHKIFDRPMLSYVLDASAGLKPDSIITVVNNSLEDLGSIITLPGNLKTVIQKTQDGTGHAFKCALPSIKGFSGTIVIMNGDTPLITTSTLKKFIASHKRAGNSISVLSFNASDPHGYGRILRGPKGVPEGIVEEKDASREQKQITEVNSGVYAIETSSLGLVERIKKNLKKNEYYLTDVVGLAIEGGHRTGVYPIGTEDEFIGVNSREDLLAAHEAMRSRAIDSFLKKGVTFIDSFTAYISPDSRIGSDSLIYPNVFIHGKTTIGKGCTVFPNSRIVDSIIKDGAVIKDSSLIEESTVGRDAHVGPMAHLRPGAVIGDRARIGNFVEVKKSTIGRNTKAMHLSYIGDAEVGADSNIGAGTITCNYDGKRKHPTTIGKGVFIGSDSQLVAPVQIGDDAYVGAGSTITRDVEARALAVSRTKQKNYPGYKREKKG